MSGVPEGIPVPGRRTLLRLQQEDEAAAAAAAAAAAQGKDCAFCGREGHGRAECPVGAFDKKGESSDWVSRHAELYGNMTEAEVRRLQR